MDWAMSEHEAAGEEAGDQGAPAVAPAPQAKPPATPHLILNPAWLPPAIGFAHVVVPAPGGDERAHDVDTKGGPS